jgi:hypothetical protein
MEVPLIMAFSIPLPGSEPTIFGTEPRFELLSKPFFRFLVDLMKVLSVCRFLQRLNFSDISYLGFSSQEFGKYKSRTKEETDLYLIL